MCRRRRAIRFQGVSDQTGHRRAATAAAALFFLVGVIVLAWNIPLPLIAYSPGPVSDAAEAVVVDGAPTFPPEGELVMLTVTGQDLNLFEALVAGVDPTVDVLARQAVRQPDETDEDYRRRNLQLMDESTATAITVALRHVGVEEAPQSVFITGYAADTPAGQVLEIGDRITGLDATDIATTEDLAEAMADNAPGDVVPIAVVRNGEEMQYEIELAALEEEAGRPFIGIFVRSLPYWIDINSGIVGGPSAGLMYSLAIIEVLTEGDMTSGHVIAGTGTVDTEGNVGAIGGVRQKVVAAEAAGAEYMFVPINNHESAFTAPRGEMELIPVETVQDALDFMETLG